MGEALGMIETRGLVGVLFWVLLYSGPEFSRDDDGDAGAGRVRQFIEAGLVAQHRDAGAGIEEKRWLHGAARSKLEDRTLVRGGAGRRGGEVPSLRIFFREVAGNLGE